MISCLFKRKRYMITCIFLYFTMYFRFTTVMRNINTLQQNFKPATDLKIICNVKYFVLLLHNTYMFNSNDIIIHVQSFDKRQSVTNYIDAYIIYTISLYFKDDKKLK